MTFGEARENLKSKMEQCERDRVFRLTSYNFHPEMVWEVYHSDMKYYNRLLKMLDEVEKEVRYDR